MKRGRKPGPVKKQHRQIESIPLQMIGYIETSPRPVTPVEIANAFKRSLVTTKADLKRLADAQRIGRISEGRNVQYTKFEKPCKK